MIVSIPGLLATYRAEAAGLVLFLAPGYLLGMATDFAGFRRLVRVQQAVWSVALSVPLSLLLGSLLGRVLSPHATTAIFVALAVIAVAVAAMQWRAPRALPVAGDLQPRTVILLALALGLALPLLTLPVQVGQRLFETTVSYDWSVRVPMVRAAIEQKVPPLNPLSAMDHGHAAPLRYYYFWYVLAAELCRLAGAGAREGLSASGAWAALDFLAVLYLALQNFVLAQTRRQRRFLLGALTACVMGLDLIPNLVMLFARGIGLNADAEWWLQDRSPSWLSSCLYAPHHVAGIATAFMGFMAIVMCADKSDGAAPRSKWPMHALVAAVCFAAVAGDSTFVALLFALVSVLWALRSMLRGEWTTVAALALTGVLSAAMAVPFLRDIVRAGAATHGAGREAAHGIVHFALRNHWFVLQTLAKHHLAQGSAWRREALATSALAVLYFAEFGFFGFVFAHRLRRDAPRWRELTTPEQALWVVFAGAAVPAFFLSSANIGPNDLGFHAGMILKFVLLLWAVRWFNEIWQSEWHWRGLRVRSKLYATAVAAAFAIGLAGGVYQLVMERSLLALRETGALKKHIDIYPVTALSYRLFDVDQAYAAAKAKLPSDSIIQYNPESPLLPALSLSAPREVAAGDNSCGITFGGDGRICRALYPETAGLFAADPATNHAASFARVCKDLSLNAVVVTSADGAWADSRGWAWSQPVLAQNQTVRILSCENP